MFRSYLIFLVSLVCFSFGFAQVHNPYLFVKWKNKDNYKLYSGHLNYDQEFESDIRSNYKTETDNQTSIRSYFAQVDSVLKILPKDKRDLSFYIHGFGAHRSYFVKLNNTTLQKEIITQQGSSIGMHVSLSWDLGFNYLGGIPKAIDIGKMYGDLIALTIQKARKINPEVKVYMITHSMGNRVYVGVLDRLKLHFDEEVIHRHVMAAPDVEQRIFEREDGLKGIADLTGKINIYRHNTDRILTVSSEVSESTRLGLTGLSDEMIESIPQNISIVDCSLLNDNERFDFGNHNYYYQSPTVRQDIFNFLFDKNEALNNTREVLKNPRRFVLQFPEKNQ